MRLLIKDRVLSWLLSNGKVGAGDSVVAGIVLSLAENMSVYDAIRFGVATERAAVMIAGAELFRREGAERLCLG